MFSIPLGPFPKRFCGFLLNSTRKRLCASGERNCGIPSLALLGGRERGRERLYRWGGREGGMEGGSLEYHSHGGLPVLSLEWKGPSQHLILQERPDHNKKSTTKAVNVPLRLRMTTSLLSCHVPSCSPPQGPYTPLYHRMKKSFCLLLLLC